MLWRVFVAAEIGAAWGMKKEYQKIVKKV